ncbi:MAG: DUF1800 family protein [Mariniblastus sp.]
MLISKNLSEVKQDSALAIAECWQPWSPTKTQPWNARRVAHLHRRAGFGATWTEIERDLKSGHQASVERFLAGRVYDYGVPDEFNSLAELIGNAASTSDNPNRLQAWWLYRMIFTPNPLTEKVCLLWHHHFATSNAKVNDIASMHRQNQIFRKYGRGEFGELLGRVVHDPAMLVFLDADSNRVGHPNENLGRELLELFSLGQGNFEEKDVTNASKALTGWTVKEGRFEFAKERHDNSEKVLLGMKGAWTGDDVLRIVLNHRATSKRITARVCEMLMGENVVSDSQMKSLADGFQKQNLSIDWLLRTVLKSNLFFSDANIGTRVRSAVEFVVGNIRATGAMTPPPSTLIVADWTTRLGQRLFYPPNVFGFAEGREWINSQWLISRNKFVGQMISGELHQKKFVPMQAFTNSLSSEEQATDIDVLGTLLIGAEAEKTLSAIKTKVGDDPTELLRMILTLPIANLG